ncbi:MAG TPA: response regulator transcription factor [Candidatus Binatus sp.]|nr:response regulator transcription factor [Candidatus Binatus sp.]
MPNPVLEQNEIEKNAEWPGPRILVVDDDAELCELVAEYLIPEGFRVDSVCDGVQGLDRSLSGEYSLVILDVMLPGIQGFEVLRQIRAKSRLPIIMLTARGEDVDRIVGLEIGADDYLPKPFNPRELVARIQAVLRRSTQVRPPIADRIVLGDVELETGARIVRRGNRAVDLTSLEFDILAAFLRKPGQVITREELVKSVLGRDFVPVDRSIDVHISNLRKKLGSAPDGGNRIRNVRSVGYIYVIPGAPKKR